MDDPFPPPVLGLLKAFKRGETLARRIYSRETNGEGTIQQQDTQLLAQRTYQSLVTSWQRVKETYEKGVKGGGSEFGEALKGDAAIKNALQGLTINLQEHIDSLDEYFDDPAAFDVGLFHYVRRQSERCCEQSVATLDGLLEKLQREGTKNIADDVANRMMLHTTSHDAGLLRRSIGASSPMEPDFMRTARKVTPSTVSEPEVVNQDGVSRQIATNDLSQQRHRQSWLPLQSARSTYESEPKSIASLKDEVFSTSGSISTRSTAPPIRFTVIEMIAGVFLEDEELSTLYKEAVRRMPNERFVRNQRRLLKRFFLDLRPHVYTPIQNQTIRILHGRRERTLIAQHIWSMIYPSNTSRYAQMAALSTQKSDKKIQLDRLLGAHGNHAVVQAVHDAQDGPSEESEGSDSERSGYADEETKYPNIDVAAEFLIGDTAFKQYKLNLRRFLRLDASPAKLHELVVAGHVAAIAKMLSVQFDEVARLEFSWLHELLDIGCSFEEMAKLLIEGERASPWILLDSCIALDSPPFAEFHQPQCVHSGGKRLDTSPRAIKETSRHNQAISSLDNSGIREVISELCGIAGAIPLSSDEDEYDWISSVGFTGDDTVAWIRYASQTSPATPTLSGPTLRMLDALEGAYHAIGYLQTAGICCDTFTVLVDRTREMPNGVPCVELCPIDISLVIELRSALEIWKKSATDAHNTRFLRSCGLIARFIISKISGEYSGHLDPKDPIVLLNECALAVQILSVGILSFSQGHIGSLHSGFLVRPLLELNLLGNDTGARASHIRASLVQLTCMGDMFQKPVLVFRTVDAENPSSPGLSNVDVKNKYDLFASPEDIADTWGPARFVVDTATNAGRVPQYDSLNLWAIEVGGGIITCANSNSQRLHWSRGSKPIFGATFDSKDKFLIGAVAVNDACSLHEGQSWRHPATNAHLRDLGTHQGGWESREKPFSLQRGQYVVLKFNATDVKQPGVTLKQRQLLRPSNEIDLAFLNSNCGLQISFCTGVARRVPLRELLADVMTSFVESKISKPALWEELKITHTMIETFRVGNLGQWFDGLTTEQRESAIQIVRSILEVVKDTGIDKNNEELVIAWARVENPYSSLRLKCDKSSLWARILADSEDCATFAYITPLCLEIKKHKCRRLVVAPWQNVIDLLDTAVCPQLSNQEHDGILDPPAPLKLEHETSYLIGKPGLDLIAKVWLTNDPEPRLVVQQNSIPEKYRSRLPKVVIERLRRLREQQVSTSIASPVVILAKMPC